MNTVKERKNTFLILGHGTEEPINFEARPVIPDGITLVTIAECGIITRKEDVCPMVEAFTKEENRDILENPRLNRERIRSFLNGKDIHIYETGKRYPQLFLQMFLDWSNDSGIEIFKSGTYRFPIAKADLQIKDEPVEESFCDSLFRETSPYVGWKQFFPDDFPYEKMFQGSLFPTADEVGTLLEEKAGVSRDVKKELTVSLETLFEKGGPGIYYFVVCRSPKNIPSPKRLLNSMGSLPEDMEPFTPYFTNNWISHLNTVIPLLENYQERKVKPGLWLSTYIPNGIQKYRQLQKVPAIRRQSIVQQGEGRTLRTRKRVRTQKKATQRRRFFSRRKV